MTDKAPRKRGFRPKKANAGSSEAIPGVPPPFPTPPARKRAPIKDPPDVGDREYDVGYRKPPKHAQFRPGQSGNPKGRKKGANGMKTLAQKTLTAKVAVRTGNGPKQMMRIEALLHKMVELGMKGNPRALLALFNMYQSAVPEIIGTDMEQVTQPLSESDEAALAALKEILLFEEGTLS